MKLLLGIWELLLACYDWAYSVGSTRSSKWPAKRRQHLARQPACQWCGTLKYPEVHHIDPVHKAPEKELDDNNLITLCGGNNCHLNMGHLGNWASWNSTVVEDCKQWQTKRSKRPLLRGAANDDSGTSGGSCLRML
jgi:hypothetical protein